MIGHLASLAVPAADKDHFACLERVAKVLSTWAHLQDNALDRPAREGERVGLAAGVTYLMQLMAHDIVRSAPRLPAGDASSLPLTNLLEEPFLLTSLYGRGPLQEPELYAPHFRRTPDGFALGALPGSVRENSDFLRQVRCPHQAGRPPLLPGQALLADRRNDSHTIIAQLTCAFMAFHNRMVDAVGDDRPAWAQDLEMTQNNRAVLRFLKAQHVVRKSWINILMSDVFPAILQPTDTQRLHAMLDDGRATGQPLHWDDADQALLSHGILRVFHALPKYSYALRRCSTGFDTLNLHDALDIGTLHSRPDTPKGLEVEWQLFFHHHAQAAVNQTRIRPGAVPSVTTLQNLVVERGEDRDEGPFHISVADAMTAKRMGLRLDAPLLDRFGLDPDLLLAPAAVAEWMGQELAPLGLAADDIAAFAAEPPIAFLLQLEAHRHVGGLRMGPIGSRVLADLVGPRLVQAAAWNARTAFEGADALTAADAAALLGLMTNMVK